MNCVTVVDDFLGKNKDCAKVLGVGHFQEFT